MDEQQYNYLERNLPQSIKRYAVAPSTTAVQQQPVTNPEPRLQLNQQVLQALWKFYRTNNQSTSNVKDDAVDKYIADIAPDKLLPICRLLFQAFKG
jgi:hypothetical protein